MSTDQPDPYARDDSDDYDWVGVDGIDAGHVLIQPRGENENRVSVYDAKNSREAIVSLTDEQLWNLRTALNSLFD